MRQTVIVIALLITGSLGANALSGGIFNVMDYGAHGNGIKLSDGAMTNGSAVLTSASANFTSADVGKLIMVPGGSSANITLTAVINAVNSPTSVTLSTAATASINGATVYYGTDDTTAIQNAWNAARGSGGTVLFPAAIYLVENTIFGSFNNNTQLSGYGATIIFSPILPLTPALNDRLFYVLSGTTSIRQIGIGPITNQIAAAKRPVV